MAFSIYNPIKIKPRFLISITLVFTTSFIDMFAGSLVIPTLREYTKYFGATEFEHGLIFVSYFVAQTISAIIMGYLSDKFGRKPLLIWSLIGSSFGHLFQALCEEKWLFLVSRLVTGGLAGSVTVSLAYISDTIPKETRDTWVNRLYAVTCVSWVIGPVISSAVLGIHIKFPLYLAFVSSLIVLLLSWFFMSESTEFIGSPISNPKDDLHKANETDAPNLSRNLGDNRNSKDKRSLHQETNINEVIVVVNAENKETDALSKIKSDDDVNKSDESKNMDNYKVMPNSSITNYTSNKSSGLGLNKTDNDGDHDEKYPRSISRQLSVVMEMDKGSRKLHESPFIKKNFFLIFIMTISTSFLNYTSLTSLDLLFPLYADEVGGLSTFIVGLAFSLQSLFMALLLFFVVPLVGRYMSSNYYWIIFSPLTMITSIFMVVFFDNGTAMSICMILRGMTVTPLISTATLTISLMVPPEKQGYYLSFANTAECFSRIFVPLLYSYLYSMDKLLPFYVQLGVAGLLMILSIGLFFIIRQFDIYKLSQLGHEQTKGGEEVTSDNISESNCVLPSIKGQNEI